MALMQLSKKLSNKKRCILKSVSTWYSTKSMHDFKKVLKIWAFDTKRCTLERVGNIFVPEVNRTQASQETVSKPWVWASRSSIASHTRVRWQQRDTATQPRLREMETHSSYTCSMIPFSSSWSHPLAYYSVQHFFVQAVWWPTSPMTSRGSSHLCGPSLRRTITIPIPNPISLSQSFCDTYNCILSLVILLH